MLRTSLALVCLAMPAAAQCVEWTVAGTNDHPIGPVKLEGDVLYLGRSVYERVGGTWVLADSVIPADGFATDSFGFWIGLDGTRLAVSAHRDDDLGPRSGSVYVYEKSGNAWPQTDKLVPASLVPDEQFGFGLALQGDTLVAGAAGSQNSSNPGRAFVFEHGPGGWTEVAQLTQFGGTSALRFGSAIALSGNTLAIASTGLGDGVWMFERVGGVWQPDIYLPAPYVTWNGSLDLEGDRLALGVKIAQLPAGGGGAVFVWERSGGVWGGPVTLTETDPDVYPALARTVALDGEYLYAGMDSLWVTQWRRTAAGWSLAQRLHPPTGFGQLCWFGAYVDAQDREVAIGQPCGFGAAYVYRAPEFATGLCWCGDWNSGGQLCNSFGPGGCANSTGAGAILGGCGSASVALDDLRLDIENLPPFNAGFLFMGGGTAFQPMSGGQRCVGAGGIGLFRFPVQSISSIGRVSQGPGLAALSQALFPPNGRIAAGQTWYFQFWYRDPNGPCSSTSNLSNAVGVAFRP